MDTNEKRVPRKLGAKELKSSTPNKQTAKDEAQRAKYDSLLLRYNKSQEALRDIVEFNERTFTGMGPDYSKMIDEAKEALNNK